MLKIQYHTFGNKNRVLQVWSLPPKYLFQFTLPSMSPLKIATPLSTSWQECTKLKYRAKWWRRGVKCDSARLKSAIDTLQCAACTRWPFLFTHPILFPPLSCTHPSPTQCVFLLSLSLCLPSFAFFFSPFFLLPLLILLFARRGSCGPRCPSPMKTVLQVWPGILMANVLSLEDKGGSFISV